MADLESDPDRGTNLGGLGCGHGSDGDRFAEAEWIRPPEGDLKTSPWIYVRTGPKRDRAKELAKKQANGDLFVQLPPLGAFPTSTEEWVDFLASKCSSVILRGENTGSKQRQLWKFSVYANGSTECSGNSVWLPRKGAVKRAVEQACYRLGFIDEDPFVIEVSDDEEEGDPTGDGATFGANNIVSGPMDSLLNGSLGGDRGTALTAGGGKRISAYANRGDAIEPHLSGTRPYASAGSVAIGAPRQAKSYNDGSAFLGMFLYLNSRHDVSFVSERNGAGPTSPWKYDLYINTRKAESIST